MKMPRAFGLLLTVAACSAPQTASEWPRMTCGATTLVSSNLQSTVPFPAGAGLDLGSDCWRTSLDEASGRVVFERAPGTSPAACRFRHVRFSLPEPVSFTPRLGTLAEMVSVELRGRWQELRAGDIIHGDGTLRLQVKAQRLATDPERSAAQPTVNAFAACGAPRCFVATFAGRGTLLGGGETPCRRFVDTFGRDRFSIRVDEGGAVAFAEKDAVVGAEQWNVGVPHLNGCEVTAFTGQRAGQYQQYQLTWDSAGRGTMKMVVDALFTDQAVTSLCRTSWEAPVEPCP
jgi:hypothetical protein